MSRTHKDTRRYREKVSVEIDCLWSQVGGVPSEFKRIRRKIRRAKVKSALRTGKELPQFKQDDQWDWW